MTVLTLVGLVVLLAIVILAFGLTVHQMCVSPFMWLYHLMCGTLGNLAGFIGVLVQAIGEAAGELAGSIFKD